MSELAVRPSRRRAVAAHLVIGGLLQSLFVVQSLVVLPLSVGILGKEAFGFWLATGGVLAWLSVANFGVAGLTVQRCAAAYGRGDLAGARDWFMHGLVFSFGSALLLVGLVVPAAFLAPGWLGATGTMARELTVGMIVAGCGFAVTPVNDTARGFTCALQRNGVALSAEVMAAAAAFAFTVWSLLAGWGIFGLAWGSALRIFVATIFSVGIAAFYATRAAPRTRWSRQIAAAYGGSLAPLWSASVVSQIIAPLPVVLLTKLLGPVAGPAVSVAYTATLRPVSLPETFAMHAVSSTSAALSHLVEDPNATDSAPGQIRTVSRGIYAALCAGLTLYCLGSQGFVCLWVGADSFLGQPFVFAVALASFALIQFRWLTNLGTSLGLVTATAQLQAAEGIARALLMTAGILIAGPLGIPLASAATLSVAAAVMERRLAEHVAFPRSGTGRLGWLVTAGAAAAAGCALAPAVQAGDWKSWIVSMTLAATAVAATMSLFSPEIQRWIRALGRRQADGKARAA